MKALLDILISIFPEPTGLEFMILVAGGILLLVGIVNLFMEGFRISGLFKIIDALLYTAVFLLSANTELTTAVFGTICGIAVVINILNWLLGCGISFKSFLKGVFSFVIILAVSSGALGMVGGMLKEMLPKNMPCLWQFLLLTFLFALELAAFVGTHVMKADYSDDPSSRDDDDLVKWATGDEQSVDTVSMWDGDSSSDSTY